MFAHFELDWAEDMGSNVGIDAFCDQVTNSCFSCRLVRLIHSLILIYWAEAVHKEVFEVVSKMITSDHHLELGNNGDGPAAKLKSNITLRFILIWDFSKWVRRDIRVGRILESQRVNRGISLAPEEGVDSELLSSWGWCY